MMRLLNLGCGARRHPDWVNVDYRSDTPDVIAHDLKTPLPFADESFDAVYHSHVLEHLPRDTAPRFLSECRRVLRPGGVLRVAVPDLERLAELYLEQLRDARDGKPGATERYDWILLELFDQMVRDVSGGDMLEWWRRDPMPAEDFVYARVGSEAKGCVAALRAARAPGVSTPRRAHPTDPLAIGRFRLSGETHQWMYDAFSLGRLLREAGFRDAARRGADESAIPDFARYGLDMEPDGCVRKPDSLFMEAMR